MAYLNYGQIRRHTHRGPVSHMPGCTHGPLVALPHTGGSSAQGLSTDGLVNHRQSALGELLAAVHVTELPTLGAAGGGARRPVSDLPAVGCLNSCECGMSGERLRRAIKNKIEGKNKEKTGRKRSVLWLDF